MKDSKTLFKESWAFAHKNYWKLLLLLLIPIFVQFLIGAINGAFENMGNNALYAVVAIITTILMYIVNFGITIVIFLYVKGKLESDSYTIKEAFSFKGVLILKFFVLTILVMFAAFVGYILLLVPGIILSLLFSFSAYYMVLRDKCPLDAMTNSWAIIRGRVWSFIKKALYPIIYWILLYLAGVIGLFLVSMSVIFLGPIAFVLMALLGLGFAYFMIKIMATSYAYFYKLFLEFENTAGEITEDALAEIKKRIKKWIFAGLIVFVVFIIVLLIVLI